MNTPASYYTKENITNSEWCVCYYCFNIYPPNRIEVWTADNYAICPVCNVDAVLPEKFCPDTNKELLIAMHKYWFEEGGNETEEKLREKLDHTEYALREMKFQLEKTKMELKDLKKERA